MELKATLNKPFTKEQRIDFIIEQNRKKGYSIRKTRFALEAWGMDAQEQEKAAKKAKIAQLKARLNDIDLKTIRPLRAKEAGVATQDDLDKLEEMEVQAEQIRLQIKELGE